MRRRSALFVGILMAVLITSPVAASEGYDFSYPCDANATYEATGVNVWVGDRWPDFCTEVAAQLRYRTCPTCTILTVYDYDIDIAWIDKPDSYYFSSAWARVKDDGLSSGWVGW